ncbi:MULTISPECIES: TetR/AcrR family transcriptional regulator [Winogradskyella]|uniref:TetR/AcrR family transcriptional regulator n=1 Tax=Winogradskyella TaxID=286104 RepID=UPI0015CB534A|nr:MULTISPECIES: TetR/AcrR family transcriptional regulator [Winogradskyella]QNK78712.1 TetR/AcrR family transcriptional regulator [Winogradskyella sp. PAMC22761]QXP78262.1 TetR/AcrR family transcriptional regulator [Winogradskyella sp. HaHa_3_26]
MEQKQKSELTKELILNESFKLFYKEGFKTTSVDKIMKATKLTKGAFYHHYKSKKELGIEVISTKIQKRVYDGMITPLYQDGNALKLLETTFSGRIKSFSLYDKQHGCPMNNFINEIADEEEAYQIALKRIIEEWKAALIHLLERGKLENSINKDISNNAVAIYLISAFEGIRGIRKLYNDDQVIDDYILGLSLYLKQLKV